MRLPFISLRNARRAVAVATAGYRCIADEADKKYLAERAARREAEAELAALQKWITYEATARGTGPRSMEQRRNRALRAVARYRAENATQRRTIRSLTDQLLDATGYQGEPLLPAARTTLGIDKEDA